MLKYDINALVVAEEVLGQSLTQIAASLAVAPKITTIRGLYWAGKLHENSKMKLAEAGAIMQAEIDAGKTFGDIVEEVCTAVEASGIFKKPDESEETDPQTGPVNS